jgi:hypothetical protein
VIPPTFFTVSNARYFVGTVALLNSLRLTENEGELVVLDAGLTNAQRARLEGHVTLVSLPHDVSINPLLLKAYPATLAPTGLVVIIDSDIIVTATLAGILEQAGAGSICVFPDNSPERWFAEWADLFELAAPLRRQTYVNSGFIAFSAERWPELLGRWQLACSGIPTPSTRAGGAPQHTPLWDGDQDALNAILMSEVPDEGVSLLPAAEAPSAQGDRRHISVLDEEGLVCAYQGHKTMLVHACGPAKPWLTDGWTRRIWEDRYVWLLPRVVLAEDVPIQLTPQELPLWARPGRVAQAGSRALNVAHTLMTPIPRGWRRQLAALLGGGSLSEAAQRVLTRGRAGSR